MKLYNAIRQVPEIWLKTSCRHVYKNAASDLNTNIGSGSLHLSFRNFPTFLEGLFRAVGKNIVFRAVDQELYIPEGGLNASDYGIKAWPILKSSGEFVFRRKTYNLKPQYWGRTITIPGKLSSRIDNTFGNTPEGRIRFKHLSERTAEKVADSLVREITRVYQSAGFRVTVRRHRF